MSLTHSKYSLKQLLAPTRRPTRGGRRNPRFAPRFEHLETRLVLSHGDAFCADRPNHPHCDGGGGGDDDGGGGGEAAYAIVDLGTLGGADSEAHDVDAHGGVVGSADLATGQERPYLLVPQDTDGDGAADTWFEDADNDGANDLMIDLGTLGGSRGGAFDLNNLGQVVGAAETESGHDHAFIWQDANGSGESDTEAIVDLGTLGGTWSFAMGINELGQLVGASERADGIAHAFLVDPGDSDSDGIADTWFSDMDGNGINDLMIDLGELPTNPDASGCAGCRGSSAPGINDAGWITGRSRAYTEHEDTNRDHAFVIIPQDTDGNGTADTWTTDTDGDGLNDLMIDLGTEGRCCSTGQAINDSGQVAGRTADPTFDSHPTRWDVQADASFAATDIGIPSGFEGAWAEDINDSAHVVGWAKKNSGARFDLDKLPDHEPYVWRDGEILALEKNVSDMGGFDDLDDLNGINESGLIVGAERLGDRSSDPWRAFVAVPNSPASTSTTSSSLNAASADSSTDGVLLVGTQSLSDVDVSESADANRLPILVKLPKIALESIPRRVLRDAPEPAPFATSDDHLTHGASRKARAVDELFADVAGEFVRSALDEAALDELATP